MEHQRDRLAAAIDIRTWLAADAAANAGRANGAARRLERDRLIGRSIAAGTTHDRILAWWHAVDRQSVEADLVGERVAAFVSIGAGLLLLAGIATGLAIAGAAFAYRGDQPVNLFALLGVLVGIPLVMLLFQLVFLKGGAPLPRAISDALAVLSPSRWVGAWLERRFQPGLFASITAGRVAGRFARWQLIAFGQWFAVGFFIGVLVLSGLLVVFTDLAFGWSTTLELTSQTVHDVFSVISWPWAIVLPVAVPDIVLVEASRWYRLEDSGVAASRAAALGRWWPFVMMTVLVYGLLPRLLLGWVAARAVSRATDRLLEEGPEITALLDRLRAPAVAFEGPASESGTPNAGHKPRFAALALDHADAAIVWNNAVGNERLESLWPDGPPPVIHLSESQAGDARELALQALGAQPRRVVVLTKGWEPPLLSFLDLMTDVRHAAGRDTVLLVVPLGSNGAIVNAADREVWANALARHPDAAMYVADASA